MTRPLRRLSMPAESRPTRRRVLVVDDEPYIGRIVQLKLEHADYAGELAHDGRSAVERLLTDAPVDLVLLDIMMPDGSGLDVLARIRSMPHRRDTPVIMLTARGQDADRQEAVRLGATDFLTKPFSPKRLLARIEEILES